MVSCITMLILIIQFLHTQWFQVFLFNINSFICTQLNGLKHHYITLTIPLKSVICLHTFKCLNVLFDP